MSTRSAIIIENQDGTAEGVYCHHDGYPRHHKPILLQHYTTEAKVRALIKKGALDTLATSSTRCVRFERPDITALQVIRGASWRQVAEAINHNRHIYVFRCTTKRWYYNTHEENPMPLAPLTRIRIPD